MAKIPAMLCLDIEDPYTLRSHTATEWMLESVREVGLCASCFVVGNKVRAWERLGLREVIEGTKYHDIGYHSTRHSHHPTITEISETLPPEPGWKMLWGWERHGWEDTERILARPVRHWGLTGGSWSPALARMLAVRGQALNYSPIWAADKTRPCWFAGGLNVADFFGGLDATYRDTEEFEQAFEKMKDTVQSRIDNDACYLGLFLGHPTRVVHDDFWDTCNFYDGRVVAPEDLQMPEAITADQERTAQANVKRVVEWAAADERFEIIPFSELVQMFNAQRSTASREEVRLLAERTAEAKAPVHTDLFTAAEILALMADWVIYPEADMLARRDVMSPAAAPEDLKSRELDAAAIRAAAPVVAGHIDTSGRVPSVVQVGETSIHVAEYSVALARIIAGGQDAEKVQIDVQVPWPGIATTLEKNVRDRIRGWSIHPPGLDLSWIMSETRLLSWTFKPAWTREELAERTQTSETSLL